MARCKICGQFKRFVCKEDKAYREELMAEIQARAEETKQVRNAIRRGNNIKRRIEEAATPKKVVLDHLDVFYHPEEEKEYAKAKEGVLVNDG